jgi:hypothetical protein
MYKAHVPYDTFLPPFDTLYTWSLVAGVIIALPYYGRAPQFPLFLNWYSISACWRTDTKPVHLCLCLLPGYSMSFRAMWLIFPFTLVSHALFPSLRVGRSPLRFLRSSVFPSFHALTLILMTNRIPRVRARDVILPVAPQPPGHTN